MSIALVRNLVKGGSNNADYIFKNGELLVPMQNYQTVSYPHRSAGYSRRSGSITVVSNDLHLEMTNPGGGTSFLTAEMDLTNVSSISINVDTIGGPYIYAGLTDSTADAYTATGEIQLQSGINNLSCESLTGIYRLYFCITAYNVSSYSIDINEIKKIK